MRHRAWQAALFAVLLLAPACGGGGGGTSSIVGPGPSPLSGNFSPERPSGPQSGEVAMTRGTISGDLVTVRVDVAGFNDVNGAAFEVTYDPRIATFLSCSVGSLLEGQVPPPTCRAETPGQLIVGVGQSGPTGVDVTSPEPIVHLVFQVVQPGNSALAFQNAYLTTPTPSGVGVLPVLAWYGGTLTATQ